MEEGQSGRVVARFGRLLRIVLPGVREVHAQVAAYARAWEEANGGAVGGEGDLWAVLGDSTAQGIGAPSFDAGYVGQLRRLLDEQSPPPWRILNLSRSGARAGDVLNAQLPKLASLDEIPRLVTCAIGANDLLRTPVNRLEEEMRLIMARLPRGAMIATLPQGLRPARATVVNEIIRSEAPRKGLVVADVWAHTGPPWRGKLAADGFHPGFTGYTDWASAFAEALPDTIGGSDDGDGSARHPGSESGW
ncbi:MAG: GDSL-type esterase/lipase family protein [Actinomycetota bacterium]|nr:GDSL-type esterase/lipase family protein [Actinomycetota bacterium]